MKHTIPLSLIFFFAFLVTPIHAGIKRPITPVKDHSAEIKTLIENSIEFSNNLQTEIYEIDFGTNIVLGLYRPTLLDITTRHIASAQDYLENMKSTTAKATRITDLEVSLKRSQTMIDNLKKQMNSSEIASAQDKQIAHRVEQYLTDFHSFVARELTLLTGKKQQ